MSSSNSREDRTGALDVSALSCGAQYGSILLDGFLDIENVIDWDVVVQRRKQ